MLQLIALTLLSSAPLPVAQWQISGQIDAPVTIHTYMDYQCHYCRRQVAVLQRVLNRYPNDVRWVNWLWANRGERSERFARIAYCVGHLYDAEAFSYFHHRFYSLPQTLHQSEDIAIRISLEIEGVSEPVLSTCADSDSTGNYLDSVANFASDTAEFVGTPGIIIESAEGNLRLQGFQSSDRLISIIKKAAD